jgi:MFS family permease
MSTTPSSTAAAVRIEASAMPHPVAFLALIAPYGIAAGFLSVALAYQLRQRGVAASAIAGLLALSFMPHSWKFLWAPLVDTTSTRKHWYVAGSLSSGLGLVLTGWLADRATVPLGALSALLLVGNFASTLVSMSVEGLMAVTVPDSHRGRLAGWFQAGNLGGLGVGGGLALWLIQIQNWSAAAAGAALMAVCAACCLGLLPLREPVTPDHVHESLAAHARDIFADLWALVRSRTGALALAVCFLPIGTAAATNLWSVVAGDWHADAQTVALVSGALSGVISAGACLIGGWLCDRMDRKTAYCLFGALQVAVALAMAASPRTPAWFVAWTSVYAFLGGLSYTAFSAVVLEAIGMTAAATKYSLLASLGNMPVAYVTLVEGHANDRWGASGTLCAESVCGMAGLLAFAVIAGATRKRRREASATAGGAVAVDVAAGAPARP